MRKSHEVKIPADGWTTVTRDRSLSARSSSTRWRTETGVEVFTRRPWAMSSRPTVKRARARAEERAEHVAHDLAGGRPGAGDDTAIAADAQGRYAAHGIGRTPCERFVEVCEKGADECAHRDPGLGYVTAFNALNKDTFDILPWQRPELVAEGAFNLCKRNLKVALIEALNEVVKVLYRSARHRHRPGPDRRRRPGDLSLQADHPRHSRS
ncbi:MAG: hypothetical protein U1E17_09060 [Geminicoccaceae bacterium]